MKRPKKITSQDKSCGSVKKLSRLTITLLILTVLMFGGIVYAYISTTTAQLNNVFTPSKVSCEVVETFYGTEKSGVTVQNTSDIPAYVRIKLENQIYHSYHLGLLHNSPLHQQFLKPSPDFHQKPPLL